VISHSYNGRPHTSKKILNLSYIQKVHTSYKYRIFKLSLIYYLTSSKPYPIYTQNFAMTKLILYLADKLTIFFLDDLIDHLSRVPTLRTLTPYPQKRGHPFIQTLLLRRRSHLWPNSSRRSFARIWHNIRAVHGHMPQSSATIAVGIVIHRGHSRWWIQALFGLMIGMTTYLASTLSQCGQRLPN